METLSEREYLQRSTDVPLTGFKEKSINRLINSKQTPSILNIETNHIKRDFKRDIKDIVPLIEYQLWLEAGKLDKANLKSSTADANVNYNSNLWRNYCCSIGLISTRNNSSVSEAISTLYPINIPPPSRIGPNTLSKYYQENRKHLFKTDKEYVVKKEKVEKEDARMKMLRLKSEMRNPPLDWNGNILPPKNFKKYPPPASYTSDIFKSFESESAINLPAATPNQAHLNSNATLANSSTGNLLLKTKTKSTPSQMNVLVSINKLELLADQKKNTPVKRRPVYLKKLSFKQNHPNFNQVVQEQQMKALLKSSNFN